MLKRVEVTQGTNGYPKHLYNALISDSYSELREEMDTNGGDLVLLRKRDGWYLWEKRSDWYGNLIDNMKPSGQDTVHEYTGEETPFEFAEAMLYGEFGEYLKDVIKDDFTIADVNEFIDACGDKIINFASNITEGERCLLWMYSNNHLEVEFIVREDDTSWYEDVWTYQLAIVNYDQNLND